jgi:hypothetical protein
MQYVNPTAAADHYRWHRAFYMQEARRAAEHALDANKRSPVPA